MLSTKVFSAGLPPLLSIFLYTIATSVQGAEVCKDLYSECSKYKLECQTSQATRRFCEKTCGVCVPVWVGWNDWGSWGPCSLTCGDGEHKRTRDCSVYNQCSGISEETGACVREKICPGVWGNWGMWEPCSKTCSKGSQTRTRSCDVPGRCDGASKETINCEVQRCPVWTTWSSWTVCSKTCKQGEQRRTRNCSILNQCEGRSEESKMCTIFATCENLGPQKNGATYVGFAVDTTGSMANEIKAVKAWIEVCISGNAEVVCGDMPTGGWIITSFNDPDVGAAIGPVRDQDRIMRVAENYTAQGGRDCPEMSMTGLINAVKRIPFNSGNCKVFLLTDATSKDKAKAESMEKEFLDRGCEFIPVLTDCCGKCPDDATVIDFRKEEIVSARRKRSVDGNDKTLFLKLSKKTGGNAYVMDKPSTPQAMVEFLKKEVTLGFCGTNDIAGPKSMGYKCEEDCIAMKMCWDKSVSKCYCAGNIPCERRPIHVSESRCPEWTAWLPWSACSHSCGDGKMRRERKCSVEGECRYTRPGSTEAKFCMLKSCPEWTAWLPWTACSQSCGYGKMQRERKCSVEGGCRYMSPGNAEDKFCNQKPCSVSRPCVPNPCQNDGTCTSLRNGNYRCSCGRGYLGRNCQIYSCNPNPCRNRGTCKRVSNFRGYSCDCLEGWEGDKCEKNVCDPNPCTNGGNCRKKSNFHGYACDCLKEWEGDNCEMSSPCVLNPCQNDGKCKSLSIEEYRCYCGFGYSGQNCEIDSCDPNPCRNGGTCLRRSNFRGYSCDCLEGWKGDNCEKNFCDPNPCRHGGTCLRNSNIRGYNCNCLKGWEGDNCRVPSPCVPNPCQNGASCRSLRNGEHRCSCGPGHSGQNCEIDSCDPNPCKNRGTCQRISNNRGYSCDCVEGWEGYQCEKTILSSPCVPNPCQNGGKCKTLQSGKYQCTCGPIYLGQNCEIDSCAVHYDL